MEEAEKINMSSKYVISLVYDYLCSLKHHIIMFIYIIKRKFSLLGEILANLIVYYFGITEVWLCIYFVYALNELKKTCEIRSKG